MKTNEETKTEIPYGYCHCGCGGLTNIAKYTQNKQGRIKGQPQKYLKGHKTRTTSARNKKRNEVFINNKGQVIPYGFCRCGCGNKTQISKYTNPKRNTFKGEPLNFYEHHRDVDKFCSNGHELTKENRTNGTGQCLICKKQLKKEWDLKNEEHRKKYIIENKEQIRETVKRWYLKNKEQKSLYYHKNVSAIKHYRKVNAGRIKQYRDNYSPFYYNLHKHDERFKELRRKQAKRQCENVTDSYVKSCMHIDVSLKEIPPELIELKREHIKQTRALRELKKVLKGD